MNNIEIYTAVCPRNQDLVFPDFKIGKLKLARHLGITQEIGSLLVSPDFAKQLLLKMPSPLESRRVPIYVCSCCSDLSCGATTVEVVETDFSFIWRKFGQESNWQKGLFQSEYMKRTGEFEFDKELYVSTLQPYTKK